VYELPTDAKLTSFLGWFIFRGALIRGAPEHGIESGSCDAAAGIEKKTLNTAELNALARNLPD
jgi:hypothetical protein